MRKVKISADAVLSILKSILDDEDVNEIITDTDATAAWQGKTIQEVLNVEYFTFKHRPASTAEIVAEKIKDGEIEINTLAALDRGFCSVIRGGIERVFTKDVDIVTLNPVMEYWIQTSKIKLLEDLIENCSVSTVGIRFPVKFGAAPKEGEPDTRLSRQAVVIFDGMNVVDIQTGTVCGEMAVCEVIVTVLLYPDVASYSDYSVNVAFTDETGNTVNTAPDNPIPLTSVSITYTATQQAVPLIGDSSRVGNINLSGARGFVFVFDGYNNPWINYITDKTLNNAGFDNNQVFAFTIRRKEKSYTHLMIIKDHQITTNADTGNEVHTVTVSTEGINGAA